MSKNNGGPAFPRPVSEDDGRYGRNQEQYEAQEGMTLRDYFAAKALAGMASQFHEHWTTVGIAQAAYELADAMIAERG